METSRLSSFKKSLKFYINQVITGKKTKDEIHLTFSEANPYQVAINNNVTGIIKCPNNPYLNQYEIIMSEIANLLDVDSALVYRITNENDESALFCKSVCSSEELLITMDYIFKKLYEKYIRSTQSAEHWMSKALAIPNATIEHPITDEQNLKTLIDMGINAAFDAFAIKDNNPDEFKTNYLSMILFDILTNQQRRNAVDYSIIVDKSTKAAQLAPLYTYNNSSNKELYYLNNRLVNRYELAKVIYKEYYKYIKEMSRCLTEHHQAYMKSITLICENNTDETHAHEIINTIKSNIDFISELEKEQSGLSLTETKVDYTQTTIRINQIVMKKNLLFQNKYPEKQISSLEIDSEELQEDEGIKISVEEALPQSGFSNAFIITSITAFICGLGAGIAYFLLMINK